MDSSSPSTDGAAAEVDDAAGEWATRFSPTERVASTDGRSLRRERNRDAVIVALLELIREGTYNPSTHQVADRAGVSHRSVFRYFDDLDDLVLAAIDHEIVDVMPMTIIPDIGQGPVERRIDTVLDTLLAIYNHTFPVARVARARSLAIPAIDEGLTAVNQLLRSRLAEQFAPELQGLEPPTDQDMLDAVQFSASFESFDFHRRRLRRSDDEIRRVWRATLVALLTR